MRPVVERLGAYALKGVEEEVAWAATGLVPEIDAAVESSEHTQNALSERLASAGVLPMFGFPTGVRVLYEVEDSGRTRVLSEITDRPLGQAVSMFAPGSQVVKDGWVHTADGFIHPPKKYGSQNPLGQATTVMRCPDCQTALVPESVAQSSACPVCQKTMTQTRMYRPLGFRASTATKKDGQLVDIDQSPSAAEPSLSWVNLPEKAARVGRTDIWPLHRQSIVTLNDNRGHGFAFQQHSPHSVKVPTNPALAHDLPRGAIGEIRVTDAVLLLPSALDLPGGVIATNPAVCPSGAAALSSFAEALRSGAQYVLDLDPSELTAGTQPRLVNGIQTALVYLSDTLENGAGYAVEIGNHHVESVLDGVARVRAEDWARGSHARCDSACPDCLRSWDNQRLHGRLDWRLAVDVANLALGRPLPTIGWSGRALAAAELFHASFSEALDDLTLTEVGGLPALHSRGTIALVGHPLWPRRGDLSAAQHEAQTATTALAGQVFWTDARELRSRPDVVWARLNSWSD